MSTAKRRIEEELAGERWDFKACPLCFLLIMDEAGEQCACGATRYRGELLQVGPYDVGRVYPPEVFAIDYDPHPSFKYFARTVWGVYDSYSSCVKEPQDIHRRFPGLVGALVANSFDSAPRGIFADVLEENELYPNWVEWFRAEYARLDKDGKDKERPRAALVAKIKEVRGTDV